MLPTNMEEVEVEGSWWTEDSQREGTAAGGITTARGMGEGRRETPVLLGDPEWSFCSIFESIKLESNIIYHYFFGCQSAKFGKFLTDPV